MNSLIHQLFEQFEEVKFEQYWHDSKNEVEQLHFQWKKQKSLKRKKEPDTSFDNINISGVIGHKKKKQSCNGDDGYVSDFTCVEKWLKFSKENRLLADQMHSQYREYNILANKAFDENCRKDGFMYREKAQYLLKQFEVYNHIAANAIFNYHYFRDDTTSDTVDLHYFHANEAVIRLDIFLDEHISNLRSPSFKKHEPRQQKHKKKCNVFVITGRGLHSPNKRPILKPAITTHLKQNRKLW